MKNNLFFSSISAIGLTITLCLPSLASCAYPPDPGGLTDERCVHLRKASVTKKVIKKKSATKKWIPTSFDGAVKPIK